MKSWWRRHVADIDRRRAAYERADRDAGVDIEGAAKWTKRGALVLIVLAFIGWWRS